MEGHWQRLNKDKWVFLMKEPVRMQLLTLMEIQGSIMV